MILFVEAIRLSYEYRAGRAMLSNEKKREAKQDATEEASEGTQKLELSLTTRKMRAVFDGNSRAASPFHLALGRSFA